MVSDKEYLVQALVVPTVVFQLACGCAVAHVFWDVGLAPFRNAWSCVFNWVACGTHDAEEREEVIKLVRSDRYHIARVTSFVLWVGCCLGAIDVVIGAFKSTQTTGVEVAAATMAIIAALTIAGMFPRFVLTHRVSTVLHVFIMGVLCSVALNTSDHTATKDGVVLILSLAASALCLRSSVMLITNLTLQFSLAIHELELNDVNDPKFGSAVFGSIFMLAFKLALLFGSEAMIWRSARGEVRARVGQCTQSAVSSLLDLLCDVVVELDHNLKLKSGAAKFSGMLMHRGGDALHGTSFLSFLPNNDDQERFRGMVRHDGASEEGSTSPSMATMNLRDSIGNVLRVAIYLVPYRSLCGRVHHLVGIVEESSENIRRLAPTQQDTSGNASGSRVPGAELLPHVAAELAKRRHSSEGGASGASERSSGSSRTSRTSRRSGPANEPDERFSMEVFVDSGLPVRWASDALQAELGVDAGASFAQALPDGGMRLRTWLQEKIEDKRKAGSDGDFKEHYGELVMTSSSASGLPPSMTIRRQLWVYFPAPFQPRDGAAYLVSFAMGKRACHTFAGVGTAPSSARMALADMAPRASWRSGAQSQVSL